MIINGQNLTTINIAFNAAFQGGFGQAPSIWRQIAMEVPSNTRREEYGWLGAMPQIREWLGDRVVNQIAAYGYAIENRDFEMTIRVARNDIMDDLFSVYKPLFAEMGQRTAEFPDKLVLGLLGAGFVTPCYDLQYFFDVDHPVLDVNGKLTSVANTDAVPGNGPAWFLLDTSRAIKPLVYQNRMPFQFVAKDKPTDENVFLKKDYLYGVDGRANVGFGMWQYAWGSTQPLDDAHYTAARAAVQSFKGDGGTPLGIMPNVLVVGPSNERVARGLLKSLRDPYGSDNVWANSAELIVTPWLS